jgi:hypothetical protein
VERLGGPLLRDPRLVRILPARIGELVGHDDLMTTARRYTHVVADEGELDYGVLLA